MAADLDPAAINVYLIDDNRLNRLRRRRHEHLYQFRRLLMRSKDRWK
jgi:hypothetical protein